MRPRFRADLLTTTAESEGVTYVEVRDPGTGSTFKFYDFEYALAQQLDGRPLEVVLQWAAETYGVDLTPEALDSFVDQLAALGFLAGEGGLLEPVPSPAFALPAAVAVPGPGPVSPEALAHPEALATGTEHRPDRGEPEPLPRLPQGFEVAPPPGSGDDETSITSIAHAIVADIEGRRAVPAPSAEGGQRPSPAATFIQRPSPSLRLSVTGGSPQAGVASADARGAELERDSASEATLTEEAARWVQHLRAEVEEREWDNADEGHPPAGSLDVRAHAIDTGSESPKDIPASGLAAGASTPAPPIGTASSERPVPGMVVRPPVAEPSAALTLPRRRFPTVLAALGILAAIATVAWFLRPEGALEGTTAVSVPTVHVVSPQPTTFHRWFPTTGVVVPGRDQTLGFAVAGRIQDMLAPGTTFSAGDSIARLKGVADRELVVNRLRSRIAFLEQLRSSSLDSGNKAAVRDAELKLAARKRELGQATVELAKIEIRPAMAGTIAEVLAEAGSAVAAQAPILRLRAAGPHAVFALAPNQLAAARELAFCRLETIPDVTPESPDAVTDAGPVETAARATDCTFPAAPAAEAGTAPGTPTPSGTPGAPGPSPPPTAAGSVVEEPIHPDFEGKLVLGLPAGTTIPAGTQVRLASARFESVFPVPQSAVVSQDGADRVWVLTAAGHRADVRPVEVASTEKGIALIARGIRSGDAVLVDPPASLKSGDPVYVIQ
jgi:hypothetical protein